MLPIAPTSLPDPLVASPKAVRSLASPTRSSKREATSDSIELTILEAEVVVVAAAAVVEELGSWAWISGEGVGVGVVVVLDARPAE